MIHTIDLHFQGYSQSIASYLVETSDGPVLIETGPYSVFPFLKKGLEEIGYQLEDIQHVFLTHIHLDHAGAAWAFAEKGAKVYVHPLGYKHMLNPERLLSSAKRIYQEHMDTLWGQMKAIPEELLISVADRTEFKIGDCTFKALYTPGHAVHHIAWQMGKELFAGDVGGVKIGGGMVVVPCPPPDINLEDWEESIELVKTLGVERLYLGHFGVVEDVDDHLDAVKECFWNWANWVKPYWEEGKRPEEVTALFEAYTNQQLIDFGVGEEMRKRYEAANPSWMSVAGLMRYWRKKEG